jgi:hypothetical protein
MASAAEVKKAQKQFLADMRDGRGPYRNLAPNVRGTGIGPSGNGMGYALWLSVSKDTPWYAVPKTYAGVRVRAFKRDYYTVP